MAKMMNMMKQVKQVKKMQKMLAAKTVEAKSKDDLITVVARGDMTVKSVSFKPEALQDVRQERLAQPGRNEQGGPLQGPCIALRVGGRHADQVVDLEAVGVGQKLREMLTQRRLLVGHRGRVVDHE